MGREPDQRLSRRHHSSFLAPRKRGRHVECSEGRDDHRFSPESFAKAADAAVQEAAKTLRGISGAQVVSMSAEGEGDRISVYRTTVNIAFAIEGS